MKFKRTVVTALLAGAGLAGIAHAEVATFAGQVDAVACQINFNGNGWGNDSGVVALKPAVANNLAAVGDVSQQVDFSIGLRNCSASSGTMRAYFYNATANAVTDGRLNKLSGTGAGWQYQLRSKNNATLTVGTSATVVPYASDEGVGVEGTRHLICFSTFS